jgi:predicted N-acetyltransferase YhbS
MPEDERAGSVKKIRLRDAVAADRPRLIKLINAAFCVETFLEGTRTDEQRLAAAMQKGGILVAEDGDGSLVASVYLEQRGVRGFLGMLAVDPKWQGDGLGRTMTLAAEERFRQMGCEAAELTVVNLRTELPPFYRKLGYSETGTQEFHPDQRLRPGVECHCIVMSKKL